MANKLLIGHSLGAAIAELLNAKLQFSAITFESPGTLPIIQSMIKSGELPMNALEWASQTTNIYLADVNIINTCHEQVGMTWSFMNQWYNYGVFNASLAIIPANWLENPNYVYYSILDQHQLKNVKDHLGAYNQFPNDGIQQVRYATSSQNGYVQFLDVSRNVFWKNYAIMIWNGTSEIWEKYEYNFSLYFEDFLKDLKEIQAEAGFSLKSIHSNPKQSELIEKFAVIYKNNLEKESPKNEPLEEFFIVEAEKSIEELKLIENPESSKEDQTSEKSSCLVI